MTWMMWATWALLACSGEDPSEADECTPDCATLTTTPEDGDVVGPGTPVTVSLEPADYAFDATLYGPDGEDLTGFVGSGSVDLDPGRLDVGPHELVVSTSCEPAPAPPCHETVIRFTVSEETGEDTDTVDTTDTGPTASAGHDIIPIPDVEKADVLLVMDNSCSMSTRQNDVASSVPCLVEWFLGSGMDYHIGVVTTTAGEHTLRSANGVSWIDADTPNATQTFATMALVGTNGSPEAQGLTTSMAAIDAGDAGVNTGFNRDDAVLVVAIASDSDNYGSTTATEYVTWMSGLGRPEALMVPIVLPSGQDAGTTYLEVAAQQGSPSYDLDAVDCDTMGDVGALARQPRTTFCTSVPAVESTLEVEVHTNGLTSIFEQGEDWVFTTVDGETGTCIELVQYVPDPGAEVHLVYEPAP